MPTFADEWAKVKAGKPSALFAADQIYGVKTPARYATTKQRRTSSPQLSTKQAVHQQAVYHPTRNATVWSEYSGVSSHRITGYSPLVMESISKHAQAVFSQAEYTLSKFKEKW